MPLFDTRNFGPLRYQPEAALEFPRGLPGFEHCRHFLPLAMPQSEPLIFLQSLEDAGLCFITVPVRVLDRGYRLRMTAEDREVIGLAPAAELRIGEDVLCLAVLAMREEGPTANLLAPIVIHPGNRRAVQAVAPESDYSHQHPLMAPAEEPAACAV